VRGTQNVLEAAIRHGVSRFVLISTDKAADPVSVLGASKRLAELVVQRAAGGPVTLASVRFGNVLGSRGSFLSVLADQIARAEPVTVTHPDVSRFFMTVEEAVGLVLEAAAMAEYAETFVLDMGEPVQIVDLVRNYAEQLKLPDVEIRYTGLRPGEKLAEKVFSDAEERVPSAHAKIWATRRTEPPPDFALLLERLYAAAHDGDSVLVKELFQRLVPEYRPSDRKETLVSAGAPYPDGF
jgi:FlaA1/EpsC-like NDP-sugar epimerase